MEKVIYDHRIWYLPFGKDNEWLKDMKESWPDYKVEIKDESDHKQTVSVRQLTLFSIETTA